jgi:hypothetical protein
MSTNGSFDDHRPELIFADESHPCEGHEWFAQDDRTVVSRFRAGPYGVNLSESATGAARRFGERLSKRADVESPMRGAPQREQDRSKTHRSGGHP